MVKSNWESFDECQQIFYSKVYFEEEKSLKVFCEVSLFKIFNGRIHIIFRLRRVIRWIIRVRRQIIHLNLKVERSYVRLDARQSAWLYPSVFPSILTDAKDGLSVKTANNSTKTQNSRIYTRDELSVWDELIRLRLINRRNKTVVRTIFGPRFVFTWFMCQHV